jgi:hypothetical protein
MRRMGFRFIGQPFKDAEQIGAIIAAALQDKAHDRAWIATAWGKQSGLSRLAADIETFRKRGGYIEAIVGVDEGGATVEGLKLVEQLFDAAYVFHDPGARTFHPKIYAVQNDASAVAIVGSGNLTRGGLYTNYEGSVAGELDLTDPTDAAYLDSVRAYYDRIAALNDVCKPLDPQAIEDLINDPSVIVVSEKRANKQRQARRGRGKSGMFGGKAVPDLAGAPPPSIEPLPAEEEDDDAVVVDSGDDGTDTTTGAGATGTTGTGQPPARQVPARLATARPSLWWSKELTTSDAHRKPPTSHQRNYVALSKAGHNIDWRTWFRTTLFSSLPWTQEPMRNGKTKEVTIVPFEVFINGKHTGQYNVLVDHAPTRIAGQNNTPTYLNWSSLLPVIKANDYRDWWLERAGQGRAHAGRRQDLEPDP